MVVREMCDEKSGGLNLASDGLRGCGKRVTRNLMLHRGLTREISREPRVQVVHRYSALKNLSCFRLRLDIPCDNLNNCPRISGRDQGSIVPEGTCFHLLA